MNSGPQVGNLVPRSRSRGFTEKCFTPPHAINARRKHCALHTPSERTKLQDALGIRSRQLEQITVSIIRKRLGLQLESRIDFIVPPILTILTIFNAETHQADSEVKADLSILISQHL